MAMEFVLGRSRSARLFDRYHRDRFLYDRSLTARTSSRRMELQPFGYLRTFLKWVTVVLVAWARTNAYDRIRPNHASPGSF